MGFVTELHLGLGYALDTVNSHDQVKLDNRRNCPMIGDERNVGERENEWISHFSDFVESF
jgi:hypothetical protein